MPLADGKFSSLPTPQCPIKISDRKKKDHSDKSLDCQNIHQQNEKQCGHLMLNTFVLTAKTKTEMFQFRIWTINQTASLEKFLLSTKKSYLDTYGDETHLHFSEVFIKALFAHVLFFSLQYLTAGGNRKK